MLPPEPSQFLPCFRESSNSESPGCSWESLSFSAQVTWCLSCPVLRGHLLLLDETVGMVSHFCAVSCTERSLGQKEAFLSAGDSQRPHYMADRLGGSSTSQEPLSDSPLATFSETGRF